MSEDKGGMEKRTPHLRLYPMNSLSIHFQPNVSWCLLHKAHYQLGRAVTWEWMKALIKHNQKCHKTFTWKHFLKSDLEKRDSGHDLAISFSNVTTQGLKTRNYVSILLRVLNILSCRYIFWILLKECTRLHNKQWPIFHEWI